MTETITTNRTCEVCGGTVGSYPQGCPGCGAPTCCQRCCDEANREAKAEAEAAVARTIPMHHDMPHLRPLSYFLIAGFQPRGRTELWRPAYGKSHMQMASEVILRALDEAKARSKAANA